METVGRLQRFKADFPNLRMLARVSLWRTGTLTMFTNCKP